MNTTEIRSMQKLDRTLEIVLQITTMLLVVFMLGWSMTPMPDQSDESPAQLSDAGMSDSYESASVAVY